MKFKLFTLVSTLTAAANLCSASLVQAASISARNYGVDVSSYQPANTTKYSKASAQFVIVKVSEGTNYRNPNAKAQVASTKSNDLMPMAYHFANFSSSSAKAESEADYAIASAKAVGLPEGSYLAVDWETSNHNSTKGDRAANTAAILAFMAKVKAAGYQPLLYSGAYLLNNNIDASSVVAKYSNSLWVASYASSGRIDTADFHHFPSMNGVIIWQFTDNWKGLNVDGNISVLPLSSDATSSSSKTPDNQASVSKTKSSSTTSANQATAPSKTPTSQAPVSKIKKTVMHASYVYDENGKRVDGYKSAYTYIYVIGGMVKIGSKNYYKIGTNQYIKVNNVDGAARKLVHNAWTYNNKGKRVKSVATFKKDAQIFTYGGKFQIGKKTYYRINKGRYIKAANVN